jgi:hypothetical protein
VGVAPSWGKIGLTTHVDGVLPVANGGTGQSTYTDGQLLIGNSTGNTLTKASLTAGTGNIHYSWFWLNIDCVYCNCWLNNHQMIQQQLQPYTQHLQAPHQVLLQVQVLQVLS